MFPRLYLSCLTNGTITILKKGQRAKYWKFVSQRYVNSESNSKLNVNSQGLIDLGAGKCCYDDGKKYTWIATKRQGGGIWMERVECDTVPRAELSKTPIEIPTPLADLETSKTYDTPKNMHK